MPQTGSALLGAFVRAHHTRGNWDKVFSDPLAYELLGPADYSRIGRDLMSSVEEGAADGGTFGQLLNSFLSPIYLGRAAFSERMLENASRIGTDQYIIFGAGLDSFAFRRPAWAEDLSVFELDHPIASADKRQRVEESGRTSAGPLCYAAVDFYSYLWPAILVACPGFKPSARSFCNLMGLSFNLSRPALLILIERLGGLLPRGSSLVLDYACRDALPEGHSTPAVFSQNEMELMMGNRGFLVYEHLSPGDIASQYFGGYNRRNGERPLSPPSGVNFCLAVKQ